MTERRKIRVGILAHGLMHWGGGVDFLRMLVDSMLVADEAGELQLVMLVPARGPRVIASRARTILRYAFASLLRRPAIKPRFAKAVQSVHEMATDVGKMELVEIDGGPGPLRRATTAHRINVLLPSILPLPSDTSVPWFGYIFDFQHRHLTAFFSERERQHRDRLFAEMLTHAERIIVNSHDTARDARQFAPSSRSHLVTLPFSASPNPVWLEPDPTFDPAIYDVGQRYFIICNQFWQHKDHRTAIQAFSKLADEPDLQLVCTGATDDSRNPEYFASLLAEARNLGVEERLRITGLLPKRHQIELLKRAVALVQPTLFEGGPGGGAVYDAVALGVRSLVSDLPVNREIDEPTVTFFPAGDPAALAAAMRSTLRADHPVVDPQQLINAGRQRRGDCGRVLLSAIRDALNQPAT